MKRQLVKTEDGSHSLYVKELDEHFHSKFGAVAESEHVFIQAGLMQMQPHSQIEILEIGFGTGLNALLTIIHGQKHEMDIYYTTIEAFPLTMKEVESLNYIEFLDVGHLRPAFIRMHECNWGNPTSIFQSFTLTKLRMELEDYSPSIKKYDLVYFDAFAPDIQPSLWTENIFKVIYQSMNNNGVLVTYCAKGAVKRALAAVGFKINSIPGPKGKREMTRAVK